MNKFISYEGGVSGKRRDKINEVNYASMVIREGSDIEGISRRFNSDGEGIFRYINTDEVREVIIKIIHKATPPLLRILVNIEKISKNLKHSYLSIYKIFS